MLYICMYIHICIQNAATMNEILENAWQDIYGIGKNLES